MAGVDVAAASVQFISFAFSTFQGCLEAYKFCRTAQSIGGDGDFLRLLLEIEELRLSSWGERAGLVYGPVKENEKPIEPDGRLNWALIDKILQQQELLLTSSEELKKRYKLDLPELGEAIRKTDEDAFRSRPPAQGVERLLAKLHPELHTSGAREIYKHNSTVKRLRWSAGGRDKITKVIEDLARLNGELERLLSTQQFDMLQLHTEQLMRALVSHASTPGEAQDLVQLLPTSQIDVKAAAAFKQIRLNLAFDKRDDETSPKPTRQMRATMPELSRLKEKRLKFHYQEVYEGLVSATYRGQPVLVEWRVAEDQRYKLLLTPVRNLALLLTCADTSFAVLEWMGLLELEARGRFGFIYKLPNTADKSEPRNLLSLIQEAPRVSLDTRKRIALRIAEAVRQLHTAGWLHKSIRSENVVFVGSPKGDAPSFLAETPYLIGYEQARPDTAAAAAALTENVITDLSTDLYRHPNKRGHENVSYRKRFDLYSLACVLIELALWRPLTDIVSTYEERDWTKLINEAKAAEKDLKLPSLIDLVRLPALRKDVEHSAGPIFWEAILLCISGEITVSEADESSLPRQTESLSVSKNTPAVEDDEVSLSRQMAIVETLKTCRF